MDKNVNDFLVSISKKNPYYNLLGIKVIKAEDGNSKVEVDVKQELLQLFGNVHGGVFGSIVDSVTGLAVHSLLLEKGKIAVTAEFKVNLYRSIDSGKMIGEGSVEHMGSNIASCEATIKNKDGELLGKGLSTYYILDEDWSPDLWKIDEDFETENNDS